MLPLVRKSADDEHDEANERRNEHEKLDKVVGLLPQTARVFLLLRRQTGDLSDNLKGNTVDARGVVMECVPFAVRYE